MSDDSVPRLRDMVWPPGPSQLWLVLPAVTALVVLAVVPLRLWQDYWWHLAAGRLVDVWGAVPDADHLVYTTGDDAPAYVLPWLADWVLYRLHALGDVHLVLTVRNLVAAATIFAVGAIAAERTGSAARGAAIAAVVGAHGALAYTASPTLLTLPLFVALVGVGLGVREARLPEWLIVVFPLGAALWANLNAGFVVAPLTAAGFAAAALVRPPTDEPTRLRSAAPWLLAAAASAASPLMNPRGSAIFGHLLDRAIETGPAAVIGGWPAAIFYAAAGFLLAASPWLAAEDAAERGRPPRRSWRAGIAAVALVAAALAIQPLSTLHQPLARALSPWELQAEPPLAGLVSAEVPVAHVENLRTYRTAPRAFHEPAYAGLLAYHLNDRRPLGVVFVDPRPLWRHPDVWQLYETVAEGRAWRGVFQNYGIEVALLDKVRQPKLIAELRAHDAWLVVHEDAHAVAFVGR